MTYYSALSVGVYFNQQLITQGMVFIGPPYILLCVLFYIRGFTPLWFPYDTAHVKYIEFKSTCTAPQHWRLERLLV